MCYLQCLPIAMKWLIKDSKIDASLQGKQSSLERHRIADSLNEQLFNRPGPLELIRENILKVEPNFDDAVKHGCVPFNPTCRDVSTSPVSISFLDSPSSEVDGSRCSIESLSPIAPDSIDTFTQAFSEHVTVDTACGGSSISDAVNELEDCIISTKFQKEHSRSDRSKECLGRKPSKSNKKKQQCQSKPKIKKYKYHEYKPPGTVPPTYQAPLDDRYKRLLEQQQMFLQLQVMKQNALFAAINGTMEDPLKDRMDTEENQTQLIETNSVPSPPTTSGMQFHPGSGSALDELRVTELKSELRQRGLPVSGSKAKLLERLRDYVGKKTTDGETNSHSESLQPSCFTTSVAEGDVHDGMAEAVSASASQTGNGFIKVTTYAAQGGETFQLVQAVPNSQSELQYQLVPTSVILGQGQSVMQPVLKGARSLQVSASSTADNSLLQSAVHAVVSGHDTSVITDARRYMREPRCQVSRPVQLQLSPPCSNAVSADSLLELSSAIEKSQKAVLDAFTMQVLNEQVKNTAKSQASMQTQTSCEPTQTGSISCSDHSSLLNQLQKMQLPPHAQGDYHEPTGLSQDKKAEQVRQQMTVTAQKQLVTSGDYGMGMSPNINLSSSYSGKPSSFFTGSNSNRDRAQTDPLATNTSTCTSLSFRVETPRSGQSTAFDGYDLKLERRDSRTDSVPNAPSGLTSKKTGSEASEDLLDILGEISGSSMQPSTANSLQATALAEATRTFSEDLHYGIPVKRELKSQRSACSKSKTLHSNTTLHPVMNRPYGSLPGDLNLLGGDLPFENQTVSAHGSYSNLMSKSSYASSNYSMEPQSLNFSPLQIGDDMDIDSESCFSPSNDLDWLNLNHMTSTTASGKRQYDRNQSSSVDTYGLSVMSSNLYENVKSQDPLSIFDLESSHSLVMAVDGHESDKWDF